MRVLVDIGPQSPFSLGQKYQVGYLSADVIHWGNIKNRRYAMKKM
jgi:hypothetical protein